jgi:O-antigen ligase/polysaccharide polymerase Wzy-like membrane protein
MKMIEGQMPVDQFRLGRSVLQNCLILLVCLTILAPPIPLGGSLPFLKVEELSIPILFVLYAWLLMAGFVPMFRLNGMFLIGAMFTFSLLISTWYGAVVLGQDVELRNFYDIPKIWFPVAYFTMAYEAKLSERGVRRLFYAYGFATLLVCFYAWGQWRGIPLTLTLNSYFSGGIHDRALLLTKRVYSTMGNPNVLGQLLSWAVVCFILALLAKVGSRLWSGLIIFSSVLTIAMTASRYALLMIASGVVLVLVLPLSGSSSLNRERKVRLGLVLFLLPIVGLVAFQVVQSNPYAVSRFQELKNPGQVDSVRQRFEELWVDAFAEFGRSPIVGIGTARSSGTGTGSGSQNEGSLDSEFLLILERIGLFGFAAYISYFLYPLSFLWKGMRMAPNLPTALQPQMRANVLAVRFTLIAVILALLMNIGATTFANAFLQGFLWLWLGVGVRSARTICEAANLARVLSNSPVVIPSVSERPAHDS